MITENPDYRINPNRAIFIHGQIYDDLIPTFLPDLLRLQHESRNPITVFIDSPGGSPDTAEKIINLIRLGDQNNAAPCWFITCATVLAASAAADLLSSGDYAVALPTSIIHFHGLRLAEVSAVTAERSSSIAHSLRMVNRVYAEELAFKTQRRFMFRYMMNRDKFREVRKQKGFSSASDLECFVHFLKGNLSPTARKVCDSAMERNKLYKTLLTTGKAKKKKNPGSAKVEASALKKIIEYELDAHKTDATWSFSMGGIIELLNHFHVFTEYNEKFISERVQYWCESMGILLLAPGEREEVGKITDEVARNTKIVQIARPHFEDVWPYFMALCHTLQEGENRFTATDAYWLGLIDEVIGRPLFSMRQLLEFIPDDPAPSSAVSN